MREVLVVGAARSGVAVSKLLHKHGVQVVLTDQRTIDQQEELTQAGIQVFANGHPDHLVRKYDLVVKNPGIHLQSPFIKALSEAGNEIVCEIDVAYRYAKNFVYGAITGTNGKTTTTSLLAEMLQRKNPNSIAAGNIGLPLSAVVDGHETQAWNIALELSNFQLLSMPTFRPHVSAILNLTPDHLDFMASLEEYYQSKTNIYKNQTKEDYFLRNVDDETILQYATDIPCQILDFSLTRQDVDLYVKNGSVYLHNQCLFHIAQYSLVGKHNLQNAMVAAATAFLMGVSLEDIRSVLRTFVSVEHRLEFVDRVNNIPYYNDSKGTNVDATKIALQAFEQPIIWIAGGKDKHTGFEDLRPLMKQVREAIVFGETKYQLEQLKEGTHVVNTLQEALTLAHELAREGDVVVFSPACSSYDQFKDYEERGRLFKEYVRNLNQTIDKSSPSQ